MTASFYTTTHAPCIARERKTTKQLYTHTCEAPGPTHANHMETIQSTTLRTLLNTVEYTTVLNPSRSTADSQKNEHQWYQGQPTARLIQTLFTVQPMTERCIHGLATRRLHSRQAVQQSAHNTTCSVQRGRCTAAASAQR